MRSITYNCLYFNTSYSTDTSKLRRYAITLLQKVEDEASEKLNSNFFKDKFLCLDWIEIIYNKKNEKFSLLESYMYKQSLDLLPNYKAVVKRPIVFEEITVFYNKYMLLFNLFFYIYLFYYLTSIN